MGEIELFSTSFHNTLVTLNGADVTRAEPTFN